MWWERHGDATTSLYAPIKPRSWRSLPPEDLQVLRIARAHELRYARAAWRQRAIRYTLLFLVLFLNVCMVTLAIYSAGPGADDSTASAGISQGFLGALAALLIAVLSIERWIKPLEKWTELSTAHLRLVSEGFRFRARVGEYERRALRTNEVQPAMRFSAFIVDLERHLNGTAVADSGSHSRDFANGVWSIGGNDGGHADGDFDFDVEAGGGGSRGGGGGGGGGGGDGGLGGGGVAKVPRRWLDHGTRPGPTRRRSRACSPRATMRACGCTR
jgi:hypothetical protein